MEVEGVPFSDREFSDGEYDVSNLALVEVLSQKTQLVQSRDEENELLRQKKEENELLR